MWSFTTRSFLNSNMRNDYHGDDLMKDWAEGLDYTTRLYFTQNMRKFVEFLNAKHSPASMHTVVKHHMRQVHFPAVSEVFPNAIFINTVRDPVASVASSSSVQYTFSAGSCKEPDLARKIGQINLRGMAKAANSFIKFRSSNERQHKFVDVFYTDLMADPVEAVRKIYKAIDLELSPEVEHKMIAYLKMNQQHKYGRHSYTLAQYGLDKQSAVNAFQPYMEFYNLFSN